MELDQEKSHRPGDKIFFSFTWNGSKIVLGDCFINDFINKHKFIGIKIYPALGYYPFDSVLLPLWKYAEENDIPILSHCIRGTIFFRGKKDWSWNRHPVFKQSMERNGGDGEPISFEPLDLPQIKNIDFSYNFTHPMNFLCLLEELLLRKLIQIEVEKNPQSELKNIFGYTCEKNELLLNLRNLKICLAHFGGDDEWLKYYEKDRYFLSNELTQDPERGLSFLTNKSTGEPRLGKPEQIWK